MSERIDQALASEALQMVVTHRTPAHGAIHRSDQGSQYTSHAYRQQLHDAGLVASMSRKGMPYDNAPMESFFASLKHELTHYAVFADRDAARSVVFDYIEVLYNRERTQRTVPWAIARRKTLPRHRCLIKPSEKSG